MARLLRRRAVQFSRLNGQEWAAIPVAPITVLLIIGAAVCASAQERSSPEVVHTFKELSTRVAVVGLNSFGHKETCMSLGQKYGIAALSRHLR